METNPNPILHFNEEPGASPDYRFDYVETNINLATSRRPSGGTRDLQELILEETVPIPLSISRLLYSIQHCFIIPFYIEHAHVVFGNV